MTDSRDVFFGGYTGMSSGRIPEFWQFHNFSLSQTGLIVNVFNKN